MKKLTKILSAVALCGVGAVTLADCTDINLSQAQMDKIITVVDNSDKFMKDTMDLLNKQNKKLDKSEAYDLLKLAEVRTQLQMDNIMENIRITLTFESAMGVNNQVMDVVMFDSTHYAVMSKQTEWGENYTLEYNYTKQEGDAQKDYMRTYKSAKFDNHNLPVANSQPELIEKEYELGYSMPGQFASLFDVTNKYGITEDNVCKVDALENGNYVIYAIGVLDRSNDDIEKMYFEIELTENAEFVRVESSSASFEKASGNMSNYAYLNKFAFEKGVVDKNVMLEKVAVANVFAESQTNA